MVDLDISGEHHSWSDAQKESFLENEREDARLYTIFFSLFAGFCLIGLHSLIVGSENYPAKDMDTFCLSLHSIQIS